MRNPIIQTLWIGDSLSIMEQLAIESFLRNGHEFHLYVYNEVGGLPEGVVVQDANNILPSSKIFKTKHGSYAGFSNIFRYKLLFEKGNYWVDTDVVCLRTFSDDQEHVFASERLDQPTADRKLHITTCVIKAPIHSAIMDYCYNAASEMGKEPEKLEWGDIGPKLLEKAVHRFKMTDYVAEPNVYCPVDYWNWNHLINAPVTEDMCVGAKAIHLWNEMWRKNGADKSGTFDPNSVYEWLKAIYLQEPCKVISKIISIQNCINNTANAKYLQLDDAHNMLKYRISEVANTNVWRNPIRKIKAYKAVLKTYHDIN
jgi:hypothetical protein